MSLMKLDRKILEEVAAEPGISLISISRRLKDSATDDTIRKHAYKLCALNYIRLSQAAILFPLKKCKDFLANVETSESKREET